MSLKMRRARAGGRRAGIGLALTLLAWSGDAAVLGDVSAFGLEGNTAEVRTADGALIRVTFLAQDVIRLQAGRGAVLEDEGSGVAPIILDPLPRHVLVRLEERADHRALITAVVELRIYPAPLRFELWRRDRSVPLWRELKPLDLGPKATTQTLSSTPAERFFGGGQHNGAFEFKGRLMDISYSGGWEEGDRPSPAPLYLSSAGYGVLRNTWRNGVYDFRSPGYLTATHQESRFDAYYLVGESVARLLELYTGLTGRAPLLPRWAFGYGDADCYNDRDNADKPGTVPEGWSDGPTGTTPDVVASVAERYREHDMPGSWILPNDGYGCGYVELPEVVAALRRFGFRTGLWTESGVEKIAWEVGTAGTRVQKLDVAWTGQGYQWAVDANHAAAQGFLDGSDARPFIWTVMGWAGIQRYAVTWTGDQAGGFDFIRWHIPTLIGSSLSGMSYTTGDVDGIFGGSAESYTRDLQWKCFTPVLMGMSGWSRAVRKHPWWFEEPYRSINRRFLKLRSRLMPYLYTLAHETERTGAPMVRGLIWDHPEDRHALTEDFKHQFFLGRELLVAPVFRSQRASGGWREGIYLPRGRWVDFWNGTVSEAGPEGRVLAIPVDLATIPVLVRAGAIIPMYPESLYDGQLAPDPLTLEVYPDGVSELTLYEDDGETRAYRKGAFAEQRVRVEAGPYGRGDVEVVLEPTTGSYSGMLEERSYEVVVHGHPAPAAVSLQGRPLPRLDGAAAVARAGAGWYHDASDRGDVTYLKLGRLSVRTRHHLLLRQPARPVFPAPGSYPTPPAASPEVPADALKVVARPAEEPGYPLENALDGNPATWFRTIRDASFSYGPHELVLHLGGRRLVEGVRLLPRTDKHWQYGQVREYEISLGDVNGTWGEPVARGVLEQQREAQEIRFPPRAGRLLRLRVLSTHDGADPMVLSAVTEQGVHDALSPVKVGSVTISELAVLERQPPDRPRQTVPLPCSQVSGAGSVQVGGLAFDASLGGIGALRHDFALHGEWQRFSAEVGVADGGDGAAAFQVWGDGKMLWDSGPLRAGRIEKPRVDVRGLSSLSLRVLFLDGAPAAHWLTPELLGFAGDTVAPVAYSE